MSAELAVIQQVKNITKSLQGAVAVDSLYARGSIASTITYNNLNDGTLNLPAISTTELYSKWVAFEEQGLLGNISSAYNDGQFLNSLDADGYENDLENGNLYSGRRMTTNKMRISTGYIFRGIRIQQEALGTFSHLQLVVDELRVEGIIALSAVSTAGTQPNGCSGKNGHSDSYVAANGKPGIQFADALLWGFTPKGGKGGNAGAYVGGSAGVGFSGGGAQANLGGGGHNTSRGGSGGGAVILFCQSVSGSGYITVAGTNAYSGGGGNQGAGGGGGIILIHTVSWSGTVGLNVSGGIGAGGGQAGQDGSYAILRIEADGSLTLMVHSENGVSADLNGQTPLHGADASIAW